MNTTNLCGKVWLVGAGPGDPELLTLKAVRVLAGANVVLVDDLVDPRILEHARPTARIVHVGKRGGCRSTSQAFIEKLMIRLARRGAVVVRLKGGDPFVFGRGGEEAEALNQAGISCEVVNGITAGIAVPAAIGIPVTHRELAHGVTFITGHARGASNPDSSSPDSSSPDWAALRAGGTTLVIYMGMRRVETLVKGMLAAGYPADTPACAIQNGTLETQATVLSTLSALSKRITEAGLGSPGILIIGDVVRLANVATISSQQRAA